MKILVKGDLVRIPQQTILTQVADSWKLRVMKDPDFGVILESGGESCVGFIDGQSWKVKTRQLQLCGVK